MKKYAGTFICILFTGLFITCSSAPKVDLTGVTSYYVRANGNDRNAGISEDAPFKTLTHAVQTASKTSVKTITVIGTLNECTVIDKVNKTQFEVNKVTDASNESFNFHMQNLNQFGVAMLSGSYDNKNPEEILITGKPNATEAEKAVLISDGKYPTLQINLSAIRLENIEIIGNKTPCIAMGGSDLILAKGAKITQSPYFGILSMASVLIMRDNAEVSYNSGSNNVGIELASGSVGILLDNALVTHNKSTGNCGGIALSGSTLYLRDNATVSNNSAGGYGGGILTFPDKKNGYISMLEISDNASVVKNNANIGGGILIQDLLFLYDNVNISENSAAKEGGGVFALTDGASVIVNADKVNDIIRNNHAPVYPNINMDFNKIE